MELAGGSAFNGDTPSSLDIGDTIRTPQEIEWSPVRVSKSCNHTIIWLRKIFENLCKFWTNERKTGKKGTNFLSLSQFDKGVLFSHYFM